MVFVQTARTIVLACCLYSSALSLVAAQVTVFAAASLTESLREIATDYSKTKPDEIVFNFGGSSTLARQIEEGAPADIFFSADQAQMNRLEAKKLIAQNTRVDRVSNSLVIVVAKNGGAAVRTPKDLASPEVHRIALGDPSAVPIGVYARAFLEQAGLWKAVAPKIVPTENVRAALAAVESGNADASIVYKTDALISKEIKVVYAVPPDKGPAIVYPVALVQAGPNPKAAARFLQYLTSSSALGVFEKHGFLVLH